jgi:hypothetical protein
MLLYYSAILDLLRNNFSLGEAEILILKTDPVSRLSMVKTVVAGVDLLMSMWY